jgi:HEAT repeat protein
MRSPRFSVSQHVSFLPGRLVACGLAVSLLLVGAPARAGRGSSPQAVASAIASGSPDAIKSELERAEYLVCAACVDYVMPLIDSGDPSVREVAGWWLVRRGVRQQVFTDMLGRLSQPDSVRARNAADVLGSFALPQAIPALGAALSNPVFDGEARVAMARALGSIRRPAAAAPLRAVLGDPQAVVRAAALAAIRQVDGFRDGSVAVPLLTDGDDAVKVQAIYTVAELPTAAATPLLVQILQNDTNPSVRKRAAWALGHIGASATLAGPALGQAASADSSPLVRSLARAAIANLSP